MHAAPHIDDQEIQSIIDDFERIAFHSNNFLTPIEDDHSSPYSSVEAKLWQPSHGDSDVDEERESYATTSSTLPLPSSLKPSKYPPAKSRPSTLTPLDSNSRVRIEKLEVALLYLGVTFTPLMLHKLHESLQIAPDGTVSYGEFVDQTAAILKGETETSDDEEDPPENEHSPQVGELMNKLHESERAKEKLTKEVEKYKTLLLEKEKAYSAMEEDVLHTRMACQQLEAELHQSKAQQKRLEDNERRARENHKDYRQVIQLLELEVANLKKQMENEEENPLFKKRLSVLGCQVRKVEASQNLHKMLGNNLLAFVRICRASLSNENGSSSRLTPSQLVLEADRLILEANKMFQSDKADLPFGWEEAFTEIGEKYYINHMNEETQWERPTEQHNRFTTSPKLQ